MKNKNILDNGILKHRKDRLYLFLACTAAIGAALCLYIAYLAIEVGHMGMAFLFIAAVLIFVWPLLVMLVIKYAQRHKSLKWLIDLAVADKCKTMEKSFIPL